MSTREMTASEKLTIEALKEHDKVHPTFKAKKAIPGSSKGLKEGTIVSDSGGFNKRLVRVSTSDGPPGGALHTPSVRSGTNYSVFQVVHATRTWKRFTRERRRLSPSRFFNFENTFRLQPRDGEKFLPDKVENIIQRALEFRLTDVVYSAEECKHIARDLSGDIKDKIKSLNFPRFKIVCNVFIAENKNQGLQITSRSVWNADTDNFASYTFKNPSLIATAYVHGVYLE